MRPFDDYLRLETILDALIRIRLAVAQRRHEAHFLRGLSEAAPNPERIVSKVTSLLPPRRMWVRPRLEGRKGLGQEQVQRLAIRSIVRHLDRNRELEKTDWGRALVAFAGQVRSAMNGGSWFRLGTPEIVFIPKPGGDTFRPIAVYSNLVDRVVVALTAKYFRDLFDPALAEESHAYRSRNHSHHAAVEALLGFRKRYPEGSLHVAECDIRKFYDTVPHQAVREALVRVEARRAAQGLGPALDPRAVALLEQYLAVYTFSDVVLPAATKEGKNVDWLKPEEQIGGPGRPDPDRIGIPQGGALSSVLANLVLDAVDRAVLGPDRDKDLFYARFCDDMVLAHPDKARCAAALARYETACRGLGLLLHEPRTVGKYGADFFEGKSKLAYRWGPIQEGDTDVSPWVPFLGYHIRYDGRLRVRKESLAREMKRQMDMAGKALRLARRKPDAMRVDARDYERKVATWMTAHAAGRPGVRTGEDAGPCWVSGFRLLAEHPHEEWQLRALDRMRERQCRRLRRGLARVASVADLVLEDNSGKSGKMKRGYFGAPYSYHGASGPCRKPVKYPPATWKESYGH